MTRFPLKLCLKELDAEVEYDMDEEDVAWLKLMNNKRSNDNLDLITEAQFELLMDRYFRKICKKKMKYVDTWEK